MAYLTQMCGVFDPSSSVLGAEIGMIEAFEEALPQRIRGIRRDVGAGVRRFVHCHQQCVGLAVVEVSEGDGCGLEQITHRPLNGGPMGERSDSSTGAICQTALEQCFGIAVCEFGGNPGVFGALV
ncbi:hypothetical protein ACTD5D_20515 [Nocardia takedensis]|uniref:hypothetical protein n=1 Tax=Nocardia takedensis TaxID=259390 RepID=UPI003F774526